MIEVIGQPTHHMHVSDKLKIGNGKGESGQTNEHTFGLETLFELGFDIGKLIWGMASNVGVTLTESWTTGRTKTCAAERVETVCIWVAVPYLKVRLSGQFAAASGCSNP